MFSNFAEYFFALFLTRNDEAPETPTNPSAGFCFTWKQLNAQKKIKKKLKEILMILNWN